MSTDLNATVPVPNAAAGDPPVPLPDPGTVTGEENYEQVATDALALLAKLPPIIPHWQPYHPQLAKAIRGTRNVPPEFITSVKAEVDGRAPLQSFNTFSTTRAAAVPRYSAALALIAKKLQELLKSVLFSDAYFSATTNNEALVTYGITKQVGRTVSGTEAVAAAANMSEALGRKRPKSRGKGVPTPSPAPQSPQQ
jgi:hypothetical protein